MLPPADELLVWLDRRLAQGKVNCLTLFLDYDGTLAELAPTPEHVEPSHELVHLLQGLSEEPRVWVAILSGRRLSHVQKLVPVPGILLAGTYGLELQTPEGERIDRLEYETIRPTLDKIKPRWAALLAGREGFFLEDKGWSLALHARFADAQETEEVLTEARRVATAIRSAGSQSTERQGPGQAPLPGEAGPSDPFRFLGGHKFLEIGPQLAHKGRSVEYLLRRCHPRGSEPGAQLLYLGDDDKDEEAFQVVQAHGGIAIVVGAKPPQTRADYRLESPAHVRRWLRSLLRHLS